MSSRWPQGQQDQRSPYATYDEGWPQEGASEQPWQDDGWQDPEQFGYADQWAQAQGSARPAGPAVAQAVAEPKAPQRPQPRGRAADNFQREWDQSGGGFGEDDDLEWFSYLSGGRSAQPKPDEAPPQRRSSGGQERPRSRRGRGRSAQPDPGPATDPGRGGPPAISGPNATLAPRSRRAPADRAAATDPGRGRAAAPDAGYGPAATETSRSAARRSHRGRPAEVDRDPATDPGYGRPAPADPRHDQSAVAGWPAVADSSYQLPTLADTQYGQPPATASRQYGQPPAAAADLQYGQAPAAAADLQYGQAPAASWSAVPDSGYDQAAPAAWPAVAEPRRDEVAEAEPTGWPEATDPHFGHGSVAGWPGADSGVGQAAVAGWSGTDSVGHASVAGWPSVDSGYDQAALAGWPAVAEPRRDGVAEAEPTGWPEATDPRFGHGSVAGWPGADSGVGQGSVAGWPSVDSGYDQAALAGWPAVAEPRRDEVADAEPTGWPEPEPAGWPESEPAGPHVDHGSVAGWPAADTGYGPAAATGWPATETAFGGQATDDSGYAQPVTAGWPAAVDEETPAMEATAARAPAKQRTARKPAPAKKAPAKQPGSARAASKAAPKPQTPRLLADPEPGQQPVRQGLRPKLGVRLPMKVFAIAGAAAVVAGAAVFVLARPGGGPAHTVTTPAALGPYTEQPRLAVQMHAATLRQQIITESAGEAHNVVYAVYEDTAGSGGTSGPQIILFIGGNLSGTSAGSFISTFTGKLQGAVTTSAGSLGGAAACVPSVDGRVAECVWADNNTFGVVASQTLGTTGLADEMRQMRPLVEHVASAN
jgi:hypothetical protein